MRAIEIREWTEPDRLRVSTVARPACADAEVLIRSRAAALSYSLSLLVQGRYQRKPAFPFVPGNTVAGEVEAVGEGVTEFKPGDRVLASMEYGALAQFAVAHRENVYVLPEGIPFDQATVFNTSYNSVAAALTWAGLLELEAGQTLLVTGAAGGVGTAAIQIGRLLGAHVIAAANGEAKRAYALSQGAQHAIDGDPATLRERVHGIVPGGVDAVLEPVGGAVFDAALRCLRPGGRILPIGFASGQVPQIPANILLVKNLTVCGLYMGYYKIDARTAHVQRMRTLFDLLGTWWREGRIRPHVARRVTLEGVAAAFADVLDRTQTGHVVVVFP
jgi:NADPH2:quinone reductase